jgi:hypothetical protein
MNDTALVLLRFEDENKKQEAKSVRHRGWNGKREVKNVRCEM